jgi:hypothetical protein
MNGRSIWAVVAGVLFIIIASTLVDIVLHAVDVYPKMGEPIGHGLALLATSYRFVIGIGGGWLTARLAPGKPVKHALILGGIGVVLGLIGVALTWNQNLAPRWYAIALAALAIPQCWLGGRLFEARSGKR